MLTLLAFIFNELGEVKLTSIKENICSDEW